MATKTTPFTPSSCHAVERSSIEEELGAAAPLRLTDAGALRAGPDELAVESARAVVGSTVHRRAGHVEGAVALLGAEAFQRTAGRATAPALGRTARAGPDARV